MSEISSVYFGDKQVQSIETKNGKMYGGDIFEYEEVEGGYAITGFKKKLLDRGTYPEDVVLPDTHNNKAVVEISTNAFEWCNNIRSCSIPSSIVRIGNYSFPRNNATFTLHNNIFTDLYLNAFSSCYGVSTITVNGVIHGGIDNCHDLISIEGDYVFDGHVGFTYCYNLKSVDLSSVVYFDEAAFQGCGLEIVQAENCISVGYMALNNNSIMKELYLPKVTSYWNTINLSALEVLSMPKVSTVYINSGMNLRKAYLDSLNSSSRINATFIKAGWITCAYNIINNGLRTCEVVGSYSLSGGNTWIDVLNVENLTLIVDSEFVLPMMYSSYEQVYRPENVRLCIKGVSELSEIHNFISSYTEYIRVYFTILNERNDGDIIIEGRKYKNLIDNKEITVSNWEVPPCLGDILLDKANKLTLSDDSVFSSSSRAVASCNTLVLGNNVSCNFVPTNVKHLEYLPTATSCILYNFINIESVVMSPLITQIPGLFAYKSPLDSIDLTHIKSIGGNAFSGCKNLKYIDLPVLESIGSTAFQGSGVIEVKAPIDIGEAFSDCGELRRIIFYQYPSSVYFPDYVYLDTFTIKSGVSYSGSHHWGSDSAFVLKLIIEPGVNIDAINIYHHIIPYEVYDLSGNYEGAFEHAVYHSSLDEPSIYERFGDFIVSTDHRKIYTYEGTSSNVVFPTAQELQVESYEMNHNVRFNDHLNIKSIVFSEGLTNIDCYSLPAIDSIVVGSTITNIKSLGFIYPTKDYKVTSVVSSCDLVKVIDNCVYFDKKLISSIGSTSLSNMPEDINDILNYALSYMELGNISIRLGVKVESDAFYMSSISQLTSYSEELYLRSCSVGNCIINGKVWCYSTSISKMQVNPSGNNQTISVSDDNILNKLEINGNYTYLALSLTNCQNLKYVQPTSASNTFKCVRASIIFRDMPTLYSCRIEVEDQFNDIKIINCTKLDFTIPGPIWSLRLEFANLVKGDVVVYDKVSWIVNTRITSLLFGNSLGNSNFRIKNNNSLRTIKSTGNVYAAGSITNNEDLVSIDFSEAVVNGNIRLSNNSSLSSVYLGSNNIQPILSNTAIVEWVVPEGITILSGEFQNCKKLNNITIPVSVTSIGNALLYGDIAFEKITYLGTYEQWQALNISSLGLNRTITLSCTDGDYSIIV